MAVPVSARNNYAAVVRHRLTLRLIRERKPTVAAHQRQEALVVILDRDRGTEHTKENGTIHGKKWLPMPEPPPWIRALVILRDHSRKALALSVPHFALNSPRPTPKVSLPPLSFASSVSLW